MLGFPPIIMTLLVVLVTKALAFDATTLHPLEETKANNQFTLTESLLMNLLTTQRQILHKLSGVASDTKNITRMHSQYLVRTVNRLEEDLVDERNKIQEFADQVMYLQNHVANLEGQLYPMANPLTSSPPPVTSTTTTPYTRIYPKCDAFYELIGEDCLKFVFSEGRTWHEARRDCQSDGGDLAVRFQPKLVSLRLRGEKVPYMMVGASNLYANGKWWWLKTGSAVRSEYFAPGMPKEETCGALSRQHDYLMVDINCNTKTPYICQILPDGLWTRV